ncbi:DUF3489 domain-containing protein [Sphingomonas faeni]|uniref:DUF3489 domain-containing protein n=1 Tax=Sphingomonas faeni TaxID=185950 RepID=UPI0020C15E28|nr:DUF3489 domain-containing protein [Sphingomonas faeni]MCK8458554.1 DUF3489 domain-containing protein [Sphingomonas faeni]
MPKLSDTQCLLLSAASQRDSGSLIPLPDGYDLDDARLEKPLAALRRNKLIEEREITDLASTWRGEEDSRTGLFITPAGLQAIGIDDGPAPVVASGDVINELAASPRPATKSAQVVALLQRDTGATLPEMITATGWLPHTTRAALTGLRKKGYAILRTSRDGATCYRIEAAA